MKSSKEVEEFWRRFKEMHDVPDTAKWDAWSFGDSPRLADELLRLVLEGRKRATSDLLSDIEARSEEVPEVGGYSVILDGKSRPRAAIRTTGVEIKPFLEVSSDFAYEEGEDDRTLESWRWEYRRYFNRYLAVKGQKFEENPLRFWKGLNFSILGNQTA